LFDTYSPPLEDSLFAFSEFLFQLNWPLFRPEAALIFGIEFVKPVAKRIKDEDDIPTVFSTASS
jgi:hypothetical protein